MRIVVVDTYYPAFLSQHYETRPGLAQRPYEEQLGALMDRSFGTSDAYSRCLAELGHDAIDVVANCVPLQTRWAAEHSGPGRLRRLVARLPGISARMPLGPLLQELAIAQIEAHGADVVYAQDLNFFSRSKLDLLRSQGRLIVGQIASELPDEGRVLGFDLILTSFPHYVERLMAMGVDSEHLQIAFYERVLDRLHREGADSRPQAPRAHALAFVGGLGSDLHGPRIPLFERIASELPLELWGYGAEVLPEGSALRRVHRGPAWGLEMYQVLADSRIVLNKHSSAAAGYANNMRLFEATGTGAMLVTEAAPNLTDYFESGREVVTYDGADDLMEKLSHYLEHDDERLAIATAGQARTLRDHTYAQVMARLAPILEARLR